MKIPIGYFDSMYNAAERKRWDNFLNTWVNAAHQTGMEYGVFVEVKLEIEFDGQRRTTHKYEILNPEQVTRIFFKALDKEFEGLDQLKRALKNKAFA